MAVSAGSCTLEHRQIDLENIASPRTGKLRFVEVLGHRRRAVSPGELPA